MREITFRGYSKEWGWVYGDYQEPFGIYPPQIFPRKSTVDYDEFEGIVVIHETVGQYTGLEDMTGVKIFEGDIVHCVSKLDSADMVVIFECGQFRMVLAEKYHEYQTGVGYYDINCFTKEVIGNIHDNPELLEAR